MDWNKRCKTCGFLKNVDEFRKNGHYKKNGNPSYKKNCRKCEKEQGWQTLKKKSNLQFKQTWNKKTKKYDVVKLF